MLTIFDV